MKNYKRNEDYVNFRPDRVAMQDATAQMALSQFMNSGRNETAAPSVVHCDHLIQAYKGAKEDIAIATKTDEEVHRLLRDVSSRYGIGFWQPGAGTTHQVILENYVFPDGMMIDTDSHASNAGGLDMVAIDAGGADAVDVMIGMEWGLRMPRLIGVCLTGLLSEWATPKDVILKLVGTLTVRGRTNTTIEYLGPGAASLSATGKTAICNMGAEVGATILPFLYDERTTTYLKAAGREEVVGMATAVVAELCIDNEMMASPRKYYDRITDIDLPALEPYISGPLTPNVATPIPELSEKVPKSGYPCKVEVGLVNSCTNSSYRDLNCAASLARQATEKNLHMAAPLIVNPGSERMRTTAERDSMIGVSEEVGTMIMADACGPCIGQWKCVTDDPIYKNSIVISFNRNFTKHADDNPSTYAFMASPELTIALAIAGDLCFNPLKDTPISADGKKVELPEPIGGELPPKGFMVDSEGCTVPSGMKADIVMDPRSQRLQLLIPFPTWDGKNLLNIPLLIETQGECTIDHISMMGPRFRFRGHLENISSNMLTGAVDAFNGETNKVWNCSTNTYETVSDTTKSYKPEGIPSIAVAEGDYDEDSSREHVAMEPRFPNVRVILARNFARTHKTNLEKQDVLVSVFADRADYDKVQKHDLLSIVGLRSSALGCNPEAVLHHGDGSKENFEVQHAHNERQIGWFRTGPALNAR